MAIQIDKKPTDFCLPDCPFMELIVENSTLIANFEPYLVHNTVACKHEAVCKMWHDREQNRKKTPNECGIWILKNGSKKYATCSHCGFVHPVVCGLLDKLPKICPNCNGSMASVAEV